MWMIRYHHPRGGLLLVHFYTWSIVSRNTEPWAPTFNRFRSLLDYVRHWSNVSSESRLFFFFCASSSCSFAAALLRYFFRRECFVMVQCCDWVPEKFLWFFNKMLVFEVSFILCAPKRDENVLKVFLITVFTDSIDWLSEITICHSLLICIANTYLTWNNFVIFHNF